jgi:hypothetical protein
LAGFGPTPRPGVDRRNGLMSIDKRKSPRKELNYPAFVVVGAERFRCLVADVSEEGARVSLTLAVELPPEVILCLSANGPPCRKGRVMWRKIDSVGLQWTARVSKATCEEHSCPFECRSPALMRVIIDDTDDGLLTGTIVS